MSFCTKGKRKLSKSKTLQSKSSDEGYSVSDLPTLRRKRTIIFNRMAKTLELGLEALSELTKHDLFFSYYDEVKINVNKFEELHFVIIDLSDRLEEDQNIQERFDEMYFEIKSTYRQLTKSESKSSSSSSPLQKDVTSQIKLPKISLPVFSGDIKQWPEFIDKYNTLIHKCSSLSDTERFHYLVSSLRDDAASVIRIFPVVGDHYLDAYNFLVARYQDERELAFTCWRDILNVTLKLTNVQEFRRSLDSIDENLCILKRLNLPIDHWDFILNYHVLSKLESKIRCEFEELQHDNKITKFIELKRFLHLKCDALLRDAHFAEPTKQVHSAAKDSLKANLPQTTSKRPYHNVNYSLIASSSVEDTTKPLPYQNASKFGYKCTFCGETHSISHCKDFLQKSVSERMDIASSKQWCFNCLKASHHLKDCMSIFSCQKCRRKHHTLLHNDDTKPVQPTSALVTNGTSLAPANMTVLLATALIQLKSADGCFMTFRALLDTGSQNNFITEEAVKLLKLNPLKTSVHINGLGGALAAVKGHVFCTVGVNEKPSFDLDLHVIQTICGDQPIAKLNKTGWTHIKDLDLADPGFDIPGPVDVLLGADVFAECLLSERIKGIATHPPAFNSIFGWLLLGKSPIASHSLLTLQSRGDNDLTNIIQRFWELDTLPPASKLTPQELLCEQKFQAEHSRDGSGRYIVKLPFKDDIEPVFNGIRDIALRRFHAIEGRLARDPELNRQYSEFMEDYLASGHMSLVPTKELSMGKYYIPHHCVTNPGSHTTKLRVVFDASARDANNMSLNDSLLKGAKLQSNINEILLRFREASIVFMADIQQMYRQTLIDPCHRDYQRIFWRFNRDNPVQEYRLNTVTYGVASAPFLACRVIQQLVHDEGDAFPLAKEVLSSGMGIYVDDIVTGRDSLKEALAAKAQIIGLFNLGKLHLRKWASNDPRMLADLPPEDCLLDAISFDEAEPLTLKVLGLKWDPSSDTFLFDVAPSNRPCTKRTILSEVAKIFDPLGFLSPLTIKAKCLIQKLWVVGGGWDDTPPTHIVTLWNEYQQQLHQLKDLRIPRRLTVDDAKSYDLHGFCDSSEAAYGAILYMKVVDQRGNTLILPVCSKARVAPIKKVSLPRLELCAAVLLANLYEFFKTTYITIKSRTINVHLWSDSTVALSWLQSHSSRWATFVANRVSHIHDITPTEWWHHVSSIDNPADVCSRGQLPHELLNNTLWWSGPSWLSLSQNPQPDALTALSEDPVALVESKTTPPVSLVLQQTTSTLDEDGNQSFFDRLLLKFSSIDKVIRIIAYCLRFINASRRLSNSTPINLFLTNHERHSSLMLVVKHVQSESFKEEVSQLINATSLPKPFRKLNPFIDDRGILRVGGRICHAGLEFEQKHPALLPTDSLLTTKLIESIHRTHCHTGVNTTQFLLLQQFWIISAKRAVRRCIAKCTRCYRTRPQPLQPFMSDMPTYRVNQVKPFSIVGVDFGGPFRIKLGQNRGAKIDKAYLCLFVCLATKAVHLEVVSTLSSDGFIAALRRLVGRRGRCSVIHADCGTNFVGARNQFSTLMENAAGTEGIEFRFNPPSAPHFGGVWEIQIKAAKSHLYRIVGDQVLTFEELATLFVQIEAVLNSRPLCPVSSDPNDLSALTPGHFLTLEPLTAVPDTDLSEIKLYKLNRWQLIQSFQQHFWSRWKNEYLHTLTERAKWTKRSKPLLVNALVLIKDDIRTPLHWPLGRVVELHPGPDGEVRVATIKTANNTLIKRPLVKLCPLPIE